LLNFYPASERKQAVVASEQKHAFVQTPGEAESVVCEFIRGLVWEGLGPDYRKCVVGIFCPARIFEDPKVFTDCSIRKSKLKEAKEQR
jgi:hypothetical protein